MPRLSSYKRIVTNDYKEEDRELVDQLSGSVNDSFNALYFAVNGRLSLSENIFCTVKDVEVTVNSSGVPTFTTSFGLNSSYLVIGCQVIKVDNLTNSSSYPTGQPFITFVQNGNSVIINHISNLQPNNRYLVRIVAYG
jgi:hypothetical protein